VLRRQLRAPTPEFAGPGKYPVKIIMSSNSCFGEPTSASPADGTGSGTPHLHSGFPQANLSPVGARRGHVLDSRRRYYPMSDSGAFLPGVTSQGVPHDIAGGAALHEADALLRGSRLDCHHPLDPIRDLHSGFGSFSEHGESGFTPRQFPLQPRPSFPGSHYPGQPSNEQAHPMRNPSTGTSLSQWYGTHGPPKGFSQFDVAARNSRLESFGRAPSDQSVHLHFDMNRDRGIHVSEVDYARLSRGEQQRRHDAGIESSGNPLLQLWWGQFSGGGTDERAMAGFSQQEWNEVAARWEAGQGKKREEGNQHRLRPQPRPTGYPGKADLAAFLHPYGAPPLGAGSKSMASDGMPPALGGGGSSQEYAASRRLSREGPADFFPGDGGNSATTGAPKRHEIGNKAKRGKPTLQKLSSSKPISGDAVFVCYVCHETTDASHMKSYLRNRKICDHCRSADSCLKNGRPVKYCQLCSWIHPVIEFDVGRKSCRTELKRHNERRRNAKKLAIQAAVDASAS